MTRPAARGRGHPALFVVMAATVGAWIGSGCGRFGTGDAGTSGGSDGSSSSGVDGAILADSAFPDVLPPPNDAAVCGPMTPLCNESIQAIRFDATTLPNDWDAGLLGPILIQDEAFCSPRALRAEAVVPNQSAAFATHRFGAGKIAKAHLRYALRGPAHKTGAELRFGCSLYLSADDPAAQTSALRFELEPDGRLQIDGKTEGSLGDHEGEGFVIPSATTASDWRIVDLLMNITATMISVTGTFDGKQFAISLVTAVHPSTHEMRCGIEDAKGTEGSYVVYIDDVQLETCPLR